jgi:CrcB protein
MSGFRAPVAETGEPARDVPSVRGTGEPSRDVRHVAGTGFAIFCGGMLGALVRTGLVELWPPHPGHWPCVTFFVNIAGAALIGWLASRYGAELRGPRYRFWGSGLCGALTTFSTMQLELLEMLDSGRAGLALGYALASIAAGLAAVSIGGAIERRTGARWVV